MSYFKYLFQVSLNLDVNQNTLHLGSKKLTEKTSSKQKRASEDKHANTTKTKKNKLFDNHDSTKPSGKDVYENIDVINIEDEESSDSETICRKDQNQNVTQPLISEISNPSFRNNHDAQVIII